MCLKMLFLLPTLTKEDTFSLTISHSLPLARSLCLSLSLGICVDDHMAKFFGGEISETCSHTHTCTLTQTHTSTELCVWKALMVEFVLRWLHFKAHEWQHINDPPLCLSVSEFPICSSTQTHTCSNTNSPTTHQKLTLQAHLVQSYSFPESIFSGCCTIIYHKHCCHCQSIF